MKSILLFLSGVKSRRISVLALLLLLPGLSIAQPGGVPSIGHILNPNYVPWVTTYYEQRGCGEEARNYDTFPWTLNCSEEVPNDPYASEVVIQGSNEEGFHHRMTDHYQIEIDVPTTVNWSLQANYYCIGFFYIRNIPEEDGLCRWENLPWDWYTLYAYGAYYTGSSTIFPINYESGPVLMPAGRYEIVWDANYTNHGGSQSLPCGQVQYQIKMEKLDALYPGQACSLPITVTPKAVFADSRVNDDMADGLYYGDFSCAVNDHGQVERWYEFTAVKTTSFIQALRTGTGNFDGAIEVYTECGGTPIFCKNTPGSNEILILATEPGTKYLYRIYHAGPQTLNNTAFSTAVAFVPPTQLRAQDCGLMNLTSTSIIRSDWPSNTFLLTAWRFRFTELEPPYNVYEIFSPNGSNPQFRMSWFPQMQPGRTYSVQTRPLMYQGPTWGDFAGACVIGTAPAGSGIMAMEGAADGIVTSLTGGSVSAQLWPNPAQHEYSVSITPSPGDTYAEVLVYDLQGKQMDANRVPISADAGHITIVQQAEMLPAGVYIVQVRTESGTSMSKLTVTR